VIKPKRKHRTVGPRKGSGAIIIRTICASKKRRKYVGSVVQKEGFTMRDYFTRAERRRLKDG
jgi:hypothetical protein